MSPPDPGLTGVAGVVNNELGGLEDARTPRSSVDGKNTTPARIRRRAEEEPDSLEGNVQERGGERGPSTGKERPPPLQTQKRASIDGDSRIETQEQVQPSPPHVGQKMGVKAVNSGKSSWKVSVLSSLRSLGPKLNPNPNLKESILSTPRSQGRVQPKKGIQEAGAARGKRGRRVTGGRPQLAHREIDLCEIEVTGEAEDIEVHSEPAEWNSDIENKVREAYSYLALSASEGIRRETYAMVLEAAEKVWIRHQPIA